MQPCKHSLNRLTNAISDVNGPVRTETYGYDELNRLTSVNYGDGQTQSYTFDPMGNRLQKTDSVSGAENYSYNAANMLLTRGANSYTNDPNGNTLTGGGHTNTWDGENRLTQSVYGGTTSTFTYGADGLRRSMTVGATTTDYVLEGQSVVREKQGAAVTATYLHGPRGPEYRRDGSGNVRWYLYDGLGSVLGELDGAGNITATRKYDVYGSVRASTGTSTSKHKFCGALGHPSDDETGLVYMRARYMDPITGRFIGEDCAYRGLNWFGYARNCPTCMFDPDGRCETVISINVGIGGAVTAEGAGLAALDGTLVTEGATAVLEIEYVEATVPGALRVGQLLSAARGWAAGQGINAMYIGGIAGSTQGERLYRAALILIQRMGDAGELIHSGPFTWVYWVMQSE